MKSLALELTLLATAILLQPLPALGDGIDILRDVSGLTGDEWKAVDRGEVQARVLDTQNSREVAIVGVAWLEAGTDCFISAFQDIEEFKQSPDVLRIQKFGTPLQQRDLRDFRLESQDVAALEDCEAGDCDVKLPISAIARLDRSVDWSQDDHAPKVHSIVREEIQSYLQAYVDRGNEALIEYHDKKEPVRLQDEFLGLLNGQPRVADFAPEFQSYLARYPEQSLPDVSEFFYWSLESFGLGPVTSVTHVSVYVQPGQAIAASKQIFASHYFDSSLGLTVAIDDPNSTSVPSMYLMYVNRSRVDLLGGFFGGLQRALTRGRMREGMRKRLAAAVAKLESSCRVPAPPASVRP